MPISFLYTFSIWNNHPSMRSRASRAPSSVEVLFRKLSRLSLPGITSLCNRQDKCGDDIKVNGRQPYCNVKFLFQFIFVTLTYTTKTAIHLPFRQSSPNRISPLLAPLKPPKSNIPLNPQRPTTTLERNSRHLFVRFRPRRASFFGIHANLSSNSRGFKPFPHRRHNSIQCTPHLVRG